MAELDAALATGNAEMDHEHRQLWLLIERFFEQVRAGAAVAAGSHLQAFEEALRVHFEHERTRMEQTAYPEREAHHEAHAQFLRDVAGLVARASGDPCSPAVQIWFESRLVSWFKLHIRASDVPLARHLAREREPG